MSGGGNQAEGCFFGMIFLVRFFGVNVGDVCLEGGYATIS